MAVPYRKPFQRRPVMRSRVRFERRESVTDDGYGNELQANDWSSIAEVDAEIMTKPGSETVLASKLEGITPVEIIVRWSPPLGEGGDALSTDDRAVDVVSGSIYNIRSIENRDMRNRWLIITADGGGVAT